jgi:diamine N-acetyltransferase
MKKIILYQPELEDYWYEEKLLSDPLTMSYNAGYEVSYEGYHYDTGCIDFPREQWEEKYQKRNKEKQAFFYIFDREIQMFVGTVYYVKEKNKYECGILIENDYRGKGYAKDALKLLIEDARDNGVDALYDSFEIDRDKVLSIFTDLGFKIVSKKTWKKFDKDVEGVTVKLITNHKI